MDALTLHRLHFGFTITYHYLLPQLTMGLALLIFILKTKAFGGDEAANRAALFWWIPGMILVAIYTCFIYGKVLPALLSASHKTHQQ